MKLMKKFGVAVAAAGASAQSFAADWTSVTTGMDFSGEITAITAVVGVIAGVYVVRRGARIVLGIIK